MSGTLCLRGSSHNFSTWMCLKLMQTSRKHHILSSTHAASQQRWKDALTRKKKKVCSCHQRREQPVAIMSLPLFVLATTRNISLIVCIGTAVSSFWLSFLHPSQTHNNNDRAYGPQFLSLYLLPPSMLMGYHSKSTWFLELTLILALLILYF